MLKNRVVRIEARQSKRQPENPIRQQVKKFWEHIKGMNEKEYNFFWDCQDRKLGELSAKKQRERLGGD
jgi:hypothetical protein